jgi:hypothetical protein
VLQAMPNPLYGLPLNGKRLIDSVAFGEVPAVVYPASVVDFFVVRADMEFASPKRQSLRTAGKLPEKLSESAKEGGQSLLVSAETIYNRMRALRPTCSKSCSAPYPPTAGVKYPKVPCHG